MKCEDCKGSGRYVGLHEKEMCRACDGIGSLGETELEIAERKAVKKFGPDEIREGLRPEYACFNLTANLGKRENVAVEKITYVFLRKKIGGDDSWVAWEGDKFPATKVVEYFASFPAQYYALYKRMAPGNNVFELIAHQ